MTQPVGEALIWLESEVWSRLPLNRRLVARSWELAHSASTSSAPASLLVAHRWVFVENVFIVSVLVCVISVFVGSICRKFSTRSALTTRCGRAAATRTRKNSHPRAEEKPACPLPWLRSVLAGVGRKAFRCQSPTMPRQKRRLAGVGRFVVRLCLNPGT